MHYIKNCGALALSLADLVRTMWGNMGTHACVQVIFRCSQLVRDLVRLRCYAVLGTYQEEGSSQNITFSLRLSCSTPHLLQPQGRAGHRPAAPARRGPPGGPGATLEINFVRIVSGLN